MVAERVIYRLSTVDNRSGGSREAVDNRSGGSRETLHNSKFGLSHCGYLRLPPRVTRYGIIWSRHLDLYR